MTKRIIIYFNAVNSNRSIKKDKKRVPWNLCGGKLET